jgi:lysophospholipase L1-like esterase
MQQTINSRNWLCAMLVALVSGMLALTGCESGGDSHLADGHDFGPNNPNLFVAIGDSITAGVGLDNPADCYTVKLAGLLGKTVLNKGIPGAASGAVRDVLISSLDDEKPGFALILIGVNDLIMGYGEDTAAVNIRIMVQDCIDNKTIPVIATLTPTTGGYAGLSSGIDRLNSKIHQISSDLNVPLVDLYGAFGDNPIYITSDGLHPNDSGHAIMAMTFYDVVK